MKKPARVRLTEESLPLKMAFGSKEPSITCKSALLLPVLRAWSTALHEVHP